MKIQELLEQGRRKLELKEDANLIAKIILSYFLKKDKSYLMIHKEEEVDSNIQKHYEEAIKKIANGYPMQYITHKQEFMKLDFYVDENVLIPRPDTEILVEEILNRVGKEESIAILDMCTGSGAIGISLAKYLPNAKVSMVDVSRKALEVATRNAKEIGVEKQVKLIHSNMFQEMIDRTFDVIVSNPPYIETETMLGLEQEVQQEPKMALDGGEDGLDFYRILAKTSTSFLKQDGMLALEIGYNQKESVIKLLEKNGNYKGIVCRQDLAGNDRVILAKRR